MLDIKKCPWNLGTYFLRFHILIYRKINILSINNKTDNKKLQICYKVYHSKFIYYSDKKSINNLKQNSYFTFM